MEKFKILQLIDGGFLGGGQTNVLSIAMNADRGTFDISIAARGGEKFEEEVQKSNITFHPLELPKVMRTKYLKPLQELYDENRYDLIHTHGGVAGFYGRILKKHNPELKCVHTIHGIHYINSGNIFRKSLSRSIEQYLVQFTDRTICETHNDFLTAVKNRIADRAKTDIIPNGINTGTYANLKKNSALMQQLGLNENNFIVGNISRFDEQKNQKLILQTAYFLIRKYPQIRFLFVGAGKNLKNMQDLARESKLEDFVIFAGEQENLKDYYSIFDIFVFPSLWEGMPYVLLEAMASRLPIICSYLPNLLEVIKPDHSALIIDPRDMDDLFRKISALYQNSELREELAQNAMIESTQYDVTETVPQIEQIYRELLKQ
ncbi:MAG TPA: glycosyltransferase [Ignavibacteria bacterium]|nr:glycosyltransferase [Ignavibacteria bacterium]HRF64834.1 glycosyltransferase [Ignavibacteria bacterium]HRJ04596.1 glycosyltransferase [Ignavibacteria bacterium]HRJ85879.1 glycosyltransferase [Ignavibacteria bacterium]